MEQLKKLYDSFELMQELGLNVSGEQLEAVRKMEMKIVDDEVMPRIKDVVAPLVDRMLSTFEINISYDHAKGLRIVKAGKLAPAPRLSEPVERYKTSKRYIIRVAYPDGHVDMDNKVARTFLNVVNYAGPERVRALNIRCMGDNLVSDKKMEDERYSSAQYETNVKGLYLMTLSDTEKKLQLMQHISHKLGLGLKFEKVEKEQ